MSCPDISEEWRAVPGYEGLYQVSDTGRVWSERAGRELKPFAHKHQGHLGIGLTDNRGRRRGQKIHRLVLEAFVGPCPAGMQACHYNDVPNDNRLENLRWDTPRANMMDRSRNGNNFNANKTHCRNHHRYSNENTYIDKTGGRHCRKCHTDRSRRHRAEAKIPAKRDGLPWTPAEDGIVITGDMSVQEAARLLGRTYGAVLRRRYVLQDRRSQISEHDKE